jgi:membrane-associated protease RseP (regulator of RpoE activity)
MWLHLILLLLTVVTTTVAGAIMRIGGLFASPLPVYWYLLLHPSLIVEGLSFSIPLLCILGVHELGHYFACRHWNVRATLPYFIPVPYPPFLIGTAGAVIRIKSPIPNKKALMDIGAAGPIAGFVVAITVSLIGLTMSRPVPVGMLDEGGILFGDSLLFKGMVYLIFGKQQDVMLHPVAFAGWVGLLATFLNLLPIGQLDGGHITYALFRRGHFVIARMMTLFLMFLAVGGPLLNLGEFSAFWLLWAVLTFFLRRHPAPYDFFTPLDTRRKIIGYSCLAIFILCFILEPFQLVLPASSTPERTLAGMLAHLS